MKPYRCRDCGALWREYPPSKAQPDGSWSLWDTRQRSGPCCEGPDFLAKIEPSETDEEYLLVVYKGDQAAVQLALAFVQIASVWDDLTDGDRELDVEQLHAAFWNALVSIPLNPFYRRHIDMLQPLIQNGIYGWHNANTMQRTPGRQREIAHVIRYGAGDVIVFMAALVGGYAWALEHGPNLRLRVMRDSFQHFEQELEKRHAKAP